MRERRLMLPMSAYSWHHFWPLRASSTHRGNVGWRKKDCGARSQSKNCPALFTRSSLAATRGFQLDFNVLIHIREFSALQNQPRNRDFGFGENLRGLNNEIESRFGVGRQWGPVSCSSNYPAGLLTDDFAIVVEEEYDRTRRLNCVRECVPQVHFYDGLLAVRFRFCHFDCQARLDHLGLGQAR